jgi:hypothetical protein
MQIGDKVKTKKEWDDHREPIKGTITDIKVIKFHKTQPIHLSDGNISYRILPEMDSVLNVEIGHE